MTGGSESDDTRIDPADVQRRCDMRERFAVRTLHGHPIGQRFLVTSWTLVDPNLETGTFLRSIQENARIKIC